MTRSRRGRALGLAAVALSAWGAGCGDLLQEPDTGFGKIQVRLEEVSGDEQIGAAGAPLPQPLRVRAIDQAGNPTPRLWVEWSVLAGSGEVEPRDTFSDEDGIAEAGWTLGRSGGSQQVRAFVRKSVPIIFEATVVAP